MRHLLKRFSILVLTMWTAVTLNFIIPRLMPGNPAEVILAKFRSQGQVSASQIHAIEVMLGLNTHQSLFQQYILYWKKVFTFDFGLSYTFYPEHVSTLIGQALPWTLVLLGFTGILGFIIGSGLGVFTAWKNGSKLDSILTISSTFTQVFPYFWVAMLAVYVLGYILQWFPLSQGYSSDFSPSLDLQFLNSALYHSILPAFTILVTSLGGWLLTMRNNMVAVMAEDYMTLAQAKGLRQKKVAVSYGGRNAMLPSLTSFALMIGTLVGGNVIVEQVFAYPGLGNLLYTAVQNQDYPLMQGIFLIIVICVVLANFLADIFMVLIDPRIRREVK
ncbi:MAG TPA: ABC transporter permease [Candidatus Angelobacter sp.]|nr:ABC transporter permease [Candidatus Angelobacter sp.]